MEERKGGNGCRHYWRIKNGGDVVPGRCDGCGAVKAFVNCDCSITMLGTVNVRFQRAVEIARLVNAEIERR